MPIEIEKKYRLTKKQLEAVVGRLATIGAELQGEDFEENVLYSGGPLDVRHCALRLRRVGNNATLTYKERFPTSSPIKHQREDETPVGNPEAMEAILCAIGFKPALIYEKRRATWHLGEAKIAVDKLPFGLFMEIEATEIQIKETERKLGVKGLRTEAATYPQLTLKHGKACGATVEARFTARRDNSRII